ncbi:PucR family transcriptional regulator [Nocardia sp. NPDC003345]
MSAPLKDVHRVSRKMVGHFVENVTTCGTLPGDVVSGEITAITRACLETAVAVLDGGDIPAQTGRLAAAAEEWAREGIPITTILHAIHEGFKLGLDLIAAAATERDLNSVLDGSRMVVELLDTMNTTVAGAYVREYRSAVAEHHTAVHTLTSAVLGGHPTSTMARESGIAIADSYHVLALAIAEHPDESHPALDGRIVARRKLRRIQSELTRTGEGVLALLSVDGGTVLVPGDALAEDRLDELIDRLSGAARVPVTATVAGARVTEVPDVVGRVHELLDVVQRLHCPPGLYRFGDVALEYQLSRPGPGRHSLASQLDPLDDHPELLETLARHIGNDFNRRRTARALHIHANTVDYRLKRIGQLTGFDPTTAAGLWQLRSALVVRTFAGLTDMDRGDSADLPLAQ